MKKLLLIMLLLLSSCSNTVDSNQQGACSFNEPCASEKSEGVKDNLSFDIVSFKDSIELLKGTAVLFYSFDDCPYCKEAKPMLVEASKQFEDIKTYYVDVSREERVSDNETYKTLFEIFKPYLEEEGFDKLYMPYFVFVKDGQIVYTHTSTIDDSLDLTTTQKEELLNLFIEAYKKLQ